MTTTDSRPETDTKQGGARMRAWRITDATYEAAMRRASAEGTNLSAALREFLERYGAGAPLDSVLPPLTPSDQLRDELQRQLQEVGRHARAALRLVERGPR